MLKDNESIKNYVSSLYKIASKNFSEKKTLIDLKCFNECLQNNSELFKVMCSPLIHNKQKIDLLSTINIKMKLTGLVINFLELVICNQRIAAIKDITYLFEKTYKKKNNIKSVMVETSKPLSEEAKNLLKKYLEKTLGLEVELETNIDKSIIGGAKISYDSKLLDFSILGAITKIEKTLQNN